MVKMKNRLLRKFLTFSYGSWIGLLIGLLSTMISTRILSPNDFGRASMVTLVINFTMILVLFGTDQAFIRFFYAENPQKRTSLLYNSIFFPLINVLIISLVVFFFKKEVSVFLVGEQGLMIPIIVVLGVFSQILYRYSTLVIRMHQKGKVYSNIEILQKILNILMILLFFNIFGATYKVIVLSNVFNFLILAIYAIRKEIKFWSLTNLRNESSKFSKKEILSYGMPFVFTAIITQLFESFDKIAIRQWNTYEELGLYSAAFKIVALLNVLQVSFSTFWMPVSLEKFENDPQDQKFFIIIFKTVSIIMLLVGIITIMGKEVIVMLIGEEYRGASDIVPFLIFSPILYTLSEITVVGINFMKKPKWHIAIVSVSCVCNIIGNYLLVPNYGSTGAAISTAISYVVFFYLRTFLSKRLYKINFHLTSFSVILILIFIYSLITLKYKNIFINLNVGVVLIGITVITSWKELKYLRSIIMK